jgi:hypothetical protein
MRFISLGHWKDKLEVNTNKKIQDMDGGGALPLIIILGLIAGAGYFLLQGDLSLSFLKPKNNVEVRRLDDYPITVDTEQDIRKIQMGIKSEEELIDFLASIDKSNALTVNEKIDFDKEYLIGVTSKTLKKDTYEFKIKKVYIDKEKGELLVSARLKKPGDDCVTTEGMNMIVDIVAISKTDKEVQFETLIETFTCSNE